MDAFRNRVLLRRFFCCAEWGDLSFVGKTDNSFSAQPLFVKDEGKLFIQVLFRFCLIGSNSISLKSKNASAQVNDDNYQLQI